MLEIEMKFRVESFDAVLRQLKSWQAASQPTIDEADYYFNAPDRDFAKTGEAFRLRSFGETNRITYKGPKLTGPTKTRKEIEIPLAPGTGVADQFRQLAQQLGYRPTAIVKKRRTCYDFHRDGFHLQACCDELDGLGRFVELEIVADSAQRDAAQQLLLRVVQELGLATVEPRSYLEMVLEKGTS